MLRLILIIFCFLLSLLTITIPPEAHVWYTSVMVTEFPWIFLLLVVLLLIWTTFAKKYRNAGVLLCVISFILFLTPVIGAYSIGTHLNQRFESAFGKGSVSLPGFHQENPYSFWRMIGGIGAEKVPCTTLLYTNNNNVKLSLDYYPARRSGNNPCIIVVHGGAWRSGNSTELPEIDWYLARQGYNVASLNYRLAPEYTSPAPLDDTRAALSYLRQHATELKIDTNNFVLLGRSAGGQIVLVAAYTFHDPGIKGVVDFYGPTDMAWAYHHPDNPMVMNSEKVLKEYFGGSDSQAPQKYFDGSAINFVTEQTVPTILIYGENDAHVSYEQGIFLDKKLEEHKVRHLLLGLPWATHGCEYSLNGPSGQLAVYTIERFVYQVTHTSH